MFETLRYCNNDKSPLSWDETCLGKALLLMGFTKEQILSMKENPYFEYNGKYDSLFSLGEDNNEEQHEIIFYYKAKENINAKFLANKCTDQGDDEMMYLLDIDNLRELNIIPAFFKDIQFDNFSGIKHIITRE